jgi:uncharacterized membrane protein YdbT with pleckstrin-like domain
MSSEWLRLDEGEEVVGTGRPRTRRILRTVARATVPVVVIAVAVVVLLRTDVVTVPARPLLVVVGLVFLYALARVGWAYVRVRNVDYVLTTRNLYKKAGVFSETVTRVGLDRIQSTRLARDLTGNLFDYGSIDVSTAGRSGAELRITDLNDPASFQDALREQMRAVGGGTGGRGSGPALDAETGRRIVEEMRALRETAERLEETVGHD